MYYKMAKVATDWWIEEMKKRCLRLYPDKFNENSLDLEIVDNSLLEELTKFHSVLMDEILRALKIYHYICLTCYYFPDTQLINIAKKAQIPTHYFPLHAQMEIYNNEIHVFTTGKYSRELSVPD